MAIMTFVFCDMCNPHCLTGIERRNPERTGDGGRRGADTSNYIEADDADSIEEYGWMVTSRNKHICPKCYLRHKESVFTL